MSDADDKEYGLVMPFTCVTSAGGPHDDSSFVAGYRCGLIDAELSHRRRRHTATIDSELRVQVDLLAMCHGYTMVVDFEDGDWLLVTFKRNEGNAS